MKGDSVSMWIQTYQRLSSTHISELFSFESTITMTQVPSATFSLNIAVPDLGAVDSLSYVLIMMRTHRPGYLPLLVIFLCWLMSPSYGI